MRNKTFKDYEFTADQDRQAAATNGRKGGIKSGQVKRIKKAYREIFDSIRDMDIDATMPDGSTKRMPIDAAEMMALHLRAASGNTDALKMVLSIAGELDERVTIKTEQQGLIIRFGDTSGTKPRESRGEDKSPD